MTKRKILFDHETAEFKHFKSQCDFMIPCWNGYLFCTMVDDNNIDIHEFSRLGKTRKYKRKLFGDNAVKHFKFIGRTYFIR